MRILHALLTSTFLFVPLNTPTDAHPDVPPSADDATGGSVAGGDPSRRRDPPEPARPTAPPLGTSDREVVRWAVARFSLVGLRLPEVEIRFHTSSEVCGGNEGRFRSAGARRRIDVCVPDHGTFHSDLQRRRTLVHELAHAWDDANLTDDDRRSLLAVLEADTWYGPGLEWKARGVERFAETIVWGLYDQRRRPTKVDVPCAELHEAFVEITGHEPPGPLEPVCDPSRSTGT